MLMLSHNSSHIIYLFSISSFLFLNFFFPYYQIIIIKNFILPISSHLLLHFLQSFPSCFVSLSSHYFLLYRYTSFIFSYILYFDFSSIHFILYKFDIISHLIHIFSTNKLWVLSLSLFSFGGFSLFLITLIKVNGFFIFLIIKNVFWYCIFFFHHKVFSLPFITLIWVNI